MVEKGDGKTVDDGSLVDVSYTATLLIPPSKLDKVSCFIYLFIINCLYTYIKYSNL